jgi:hypothetical protein
MTTAGDVIRMEWRRFSRTYGFLLASIILFVVVLHQEVEEGSYLVFEPSEHTEVGMALLLLPLLVASFLVVVRSRPAVFAGLTIKRMILGSIFLAIPFFFLPPIASRDAYHSLFFGQSLVEGMNPYTTTIREHFVVPLSLYNDEKFYSLPSPYGPLWNLLAAAPVWLVGVQPTLNIFLLRIIALGALLGVVTLLYRIARGTAGERAKMAVLFGWNPLVLLYVINELHNDVYLALSLACAFFCLTRRRYILAALLLALGGLVKWIPLILLPIVIATVLQRQDKRKAATIATVLILPCVVLLASLLPFWTNDHPFRGVMMQSSFLNITAYVQQGTFFLSKTHALHEILPFRTVLSDLGFYAVRLAGVVGFLAIAARALFRVARKKGEPFEAGYTTLFAFLVLCLSWYQGWYLLWLFPLAAFDVSLMRITAIFSSLALLSFFHPIISFTVIFALYFAIRQYREIFRAIQPDTKQEPLSNRP